jgi:hypothetical protein
MPNPERFRLQAEIDSLRAILADSERRLQALEEERRHLIPVEEVHAELDRFNLPRRTPGGQRLFLAAGNGAIGCMAGVLNNGPRS